MKNFHFIYKTTHNNGYYYIGRHSTKNLKDGYRGSGKWIKSIKNKSELITKIIEKCNYCQKEGGLNMMKRYHFDNCKYKYSINEKG